MGLERQLESDMLGLFDIRKLVIRKLVWRDAMSRVCTQYRQDVRRKIPCELAPCTLGSVEGERFALRHSVFHTTQRSTVRLSYEDELGFVDTFCLDVSKRSWTYASCCCIASRLHLRKRSMPSASAGRW